MLQIYNKYGQLKVVSSTSSTGVSSVSAVSPLTSTGGTNPIISSLITPSKLLGRHSVTTGAMQEITLGTGLFLLGNTLNVTTSLYTFTSPLVNTLGTVSINQATSTTNGYLSSADWTTFNNKQNALGYIPLPTTAGTATGAILSFITDRVYGTIASPITGNITADVTGAQLGVTNIIIHNSGTAPTFGSEFKKLSGSGNYIVGVVNYIYCSFITSTEIIYSINQRT
jgi:hypothetical protein